MAHVTTLENGIATPDCEQNQQPPRTTQLRECAFMRHEVLQKHQSLHAKWIKSLSGNEQSTQHKSKDQMWIEGLSPEIFVFVSLGQSTQQLCEMRTSKQGQHLWVQEALMFATSIIHDESLADSFIGIPHVSFSHVTKKNLKLAVGRCIHLGCMMNEDLCWSKYEIR